MSIYTIPSIENFSRAFALGLLDHAKDKPDSLAHMRVLLPTRRACRIVKQSLFECCNRESLLLPLLHPIGDIDEEELSLYSEQTLDLPPAIHPIERQVLLAKTIEHIPGFVPKGFEQALSLAKALSHLMDQIYTENLNLLNLESLVPEDFAEHWQITLNFLSILGDAWPKVLEEKGVMDAADRRNKLILALSDFWQKTKPTFPVFIAGTTGSIPATAHLIQTVHTLPAGHVVLPGLDHNMDADSWDSLEETHPQYTLKSLLSALECNRCTVKTWNACKETAEDSARLWLAQETMRPAQTAHEWQNLSPPKELETTLKSLSFYECASPHEEAQIIALAMREGLETKGKTLALVTPDRQLSQRVSLLCKRWGITVDDSAGTPLSKTSLGSFFLLIAKACENHLKPIDLLGVLKHPYQKHIIDRDINRFEEHVLRRNAFSRGPSTDTKELEEFIKNVFSGLCGTVLDSNQNFSSILQEHIKTFHTLIEDVQNHDISAEDLEAFETFLQTLSNISYSIQKISRNSYTAILLELMSHVCVRPTFGTHPRLMILGQLEARLIDVDTVILGGLNENMWPPDPGYDPWMSRPMRKDFGLPSPEKLIGLSAHDFVQAFCTKTAILTRARKIGGTPTVPSRWLQRLETVLEAAGCSIDTIKGYYLHHWAQELDSARGEYMPCQRPEPTPPLAERPQKLPVTAIETWMRDPYAIYAKYILGLRKLDDIEQEPNAALYGSLLHQTLDQCVQDWRKNDWKEDKIYDDLLDKGEKFFAETPLDSSTKGIWWARFKKHMHWFANNEKLWRQEGFFPYATEIEGSAEIGAFTLTAKADRIDQGNNGEFAILDYKTGGVPSLSDVSSGLAPQLPLESLILEKKGFKNTGQVNASYLAYWKFTNDKTGGQIIALKDIDDLAKDSETGLRTLIQTFANDSTPYYSLPAARKAPRKEYQDYYHLARVSEWSNFTEEESA